MEHYKAVECHQKETLCHPEMIHESFNNNSTRVGENEMMTLIETLVCVINDGSNSGANEINGSTNLRKDVHKHNSDFQVDKRLTMVIIWRISLRTAMGMFGRTVSRQNWEIFISVK